MKKPAIQFHEKDKLVITAFLERWSEEGEYMALWHLDECEPLYLDCDVVALTNCFMELEKKGFTESIRALFQGNHFYRSDTGKCPRCWRYRPEIHWNNENIPECRAECCDRCNEAMVKSSDETQ